MFELTIPDMTCGHCVQTISRAVEKVDSAAKLSFDLPNHKVRVDSGAEAESIRSAIETAGYRVLSEAGQDTANAGNCCGTCDR